MTAHAWRGTGPHQFPDTAADDFTRASPKWRMAQEQAAQPLGLLADEVLELPRPPSLARQLALAFAAGVFFFGALLLACLVVWVAT
jgi:hypothetical protein